MDTILRIAVQKSGRLSDGSFDILRECGFKFSRVGSKLKTRATNFPIEFLMLRDDDIPGYVHDGVADVGIVGENVYVEKEYPLEIIQRLGFSKCRLSIAVPNAYQYDGIKTLQGANIATSYPRILKNFLDKNNIQADIHEISGSVEIAPSIGLAEAVCDIVSSGSTLLGNGLKEVEAIFRSEAVMIAGTSIADEKKVILDEILFRIQTVLKASNFKYIMLNVPNEKIDEVCALLPGMRSPTITPLRNEGWSSLQSVVNEDTFWESIGKLKASGAEGIIILRRCFNGGFQRITQFRICCLNLIRGDFKCIIGHTVKFLSQCAHRGIAPRAHCG